MSTNVRFLRTAKKILSHSFHAFFWHTRPSCTFSFTKAPCCLKLLIPASNVIGRCGITVGIVAGKPAEQKHLIRASQIAAHKTPSAPESPLSLCYVTDRERRGEWDCACSQNLNTCCFLPCGKLTSTWVLKVVMADWNRSNHFDTPCIKKSYAITSLRKETNWPISLSRIRSAAFAFTVRVVYPSNNLQ